MVNLVHDARRPSRWRAGSASFPMLCVAMLLASCEPAGTLGGSSGSANDYLVARQALETGNYALAIRRYERLIDQAGTSAGRLQLEYAHSLLRAGQFERAIASSSELLQTSDGSVAANARAVRGTARHEAARSLIAQGQSGAEARSLLEGARSDLGAFVESHPQLDAAGAMAARLQMIASDLRGLG
ncbi:MAG: hypothetical protein JJU09_10105 [Rhodobacteraceae bacterium]|nr:hypothetical protein [Paracoccaceae bacterium]